MHKIRNPRRRKRSPRSRDFPPRSPACCGPAPSALASAPRPSPHTPHRSCTARSGRLPPPQSLPLSLKRSRHHLESGTGKKVRCKIRARRAHLHVANLRQQHARLLPPAAACRSVRSRSSSYACAPRLVSLIRPARQRGSAPARQDSRIDLFPRTRASATQPPFLAPPSIAPAPAQSRRLACAFR